MRMVQCSSYLAYEVYMEAGPLLCDFLDCTFHASHGILLLTSY